MALTPPLLILLDTTAILGGKTRDWLEFSQLGSCLLPEIVLEEMQALGDRAPDPATESIAREFNRFYPTSGWKTTRMLAEHPSLKPAEGATLSKRSRLALEVLSCAYGLARRHPDSLVVLVATDQPMLQRLLALKVVNLCGLPLAAFLQWSRTQRRPAAVTQHWQLMRAANVAPADQLTGTGGRQSQATTQRSPARPTTPKATPSEPKTKNYQADRQRRVMRSKQISRLVGNVVTLVVAAIAIAAVWQAVSPASFNQVWRQLPFVHGKK